MRWSERPTAARSHLAWLVRLHCGVRSLPVAVAHLVFVRPQSTLGMRHWFLLTQSTLATERRRRPSDAAIIAGHGRTPCESLSPAQRTKMFWLGAVESVPLLAGGIIAAFSDTAVAATACAGGAILLTAIICWCLRHQTPDTRIEFIPPRHSPGDAKREATQEV